jgi:exo-beta-1,3-glucanase (GH17 family)
VHVKHAVEYFAATYHALKKLAPDKKVVVLETGWPTSGGRQGDAVASYENALRYIEEISSWGRSMAVDVFIFEVMDELWKKEKTDTGMAGPHFGLWYHDGRPKHATSSQAAE